MDPRKPAPAPAVPRSALVSPEEQAVLDAIRTTPFGSIEVVLHQSRIVQVVRTEKVRIEPQPT